MKARDSLDKKRKPKVFSPPPVPVWGKTKWKAGPTKAGAAAAKQAQQRALYANRHPVAGDSNTAAPRNPPPVPPRRRKKKTTPPPEPKSILKKT
jgi:hypothetical protein